MTLSKRKRYKSIGLRLLLVLAGFALLATVATQGKLPTVWAGITPTPVPPTDTPVPPTDTPVPPTDTPVPPTDTPVPPTDTPVPPTDTPVPPTQQPSKPEPSPEETPTPTPVLILPESGGAAGLPLALWALGGATALLGWLLRNLGKGHRETSV